MIFYLVLAVIVAAIAAVVIWRVRARRKPLNTDYFQEKWVELQKLCRNKDTWPEAVLAADKLLDEALKKSFMRGKNMGERMVAAQRSFTDNDGVWFGHKLRNKVESDPELKLKEDDVKGALIGIRQALKDLGALKNDKPGR